MAQYAEGLWSIFCLPPVKLVFEDEDFYLGGGRKIATEPFLACVNAVIRTKGSASQTENNRPTVDISLNLFFGKDRELRDKITFQEEDKIMAQEALAWIRGLSQAELSKGNDYIWNLHVASVCRVFAHPNSSIVNFYLQEGDGERTQSEG